MAVTLPTSKTLTPSPAEVVARAHALIPALKNRAAEAETLRRLPLENVRLLKDAGLFRVLERSWTGGYEMSLRTHLDVISTLAEGCSATAWVAGVAHAHSWIVGHMSHKAQLDVYGADPDALIAGVIGPRGRAIEQPDGSYLLSGTWPFGSGSERSSWVLLGAQAIDKHGEAAGDFDFLVPVSDIEFKDDWFVSGLQGTGSCSMSVKDLSIPAHRAVRFDALLERQTPSYSDPDVPALTQAQAVPVLSLALCGPALGIAKAALKEFLRVVPGKRLMYTSHIAHEWIPNQVTLGRAASLIHAAELVLYRIADDIDEYAQRNEEMPIELRGRIRMGCSQAVRFCLDAVDDLFMNAGASALSTSNPLQRAARDLKAINMHGLLLLETSAEISGRILLGLGSNSPVY